DEAIEAVSNVEYGAAVEGMYVIQDGLLRNEAESVADVHCARVVVIRTVASVPTVAPEETVFATEVLIDSGCEVIVLPYPLCKRRIVDVSGEHRWILRRTKRTEYHFRNRVYAVAGNDVVGECATVGHRSV